MTTKIDKKIIKAQVKSDKEEKEPKSNLEIIHEGLKRPEVLRGSTYKIKSPSYDHAIYLTINDMILNQGTEFEEHHPFEVFLSCKNLENHQWVVALTRLISAVFRKGGNITFILEELTSVFDPRGGYYKKQQFIPSVVAEIGLKIKEHLIYTGYLKIEQDVVTEEYIKAKKEELGVYQDNYPENATVCHICNVKAVVLLDGCQTCLECGHSKCG